jgi:hypothetical protein
MSYMHHIITTKHSNPFQIISCVNLTEVFIPENTEQLFITLQYYSLK